MLIALNTHIRRARPLARLAVVLLLAITILSAHGAVAGSHMASGSMSQTMGAGSHEMPDQGSHSGGAADPGDSLMSMCLAIVQAAALTLGALALAAALATLLLRLPAPPWPTVLAVLLPAAALLRRARPPDLNVLQISRR